MHLFKLQLIYNSVLVLLNQCSPSIVSQRNQERVILTPSAKIRLAEELPSAKGLNYRRFVASSSSLSSVYLLAARRIYCYRAFCFPLAEILRRCSVWFVHTSQRSLTFSDRRDATLLPVAYELANSFAKAINFARTTFN